MREYIDFDLTLYNSYRVKAKCKRALFFDTEDEIVSYYKSSFDKKKILIGSGHNIILSRDFYEEDFIIFNGNFNNYFIDDTIVVAEAGISMLDISEIALKECLSGLEMFYDIPSSLGGAVVMNAGAGGEEIKDRLVKVKYLDLSDMQVKEIFNDGTIFQYRDSFFQQNTDKLVLKAWMQLERKPKEEIWKKMITIREARWAKQPKEFPNAGSVFKRPAGYFVGAIMDNLKLKGLKVGGAKVSEKHGGFIINFDNATGDDILKLIEMIKERVMSVYGVDLEIEQRII